MLQLEFLISFFKFPFLFIIVKENKRKKSAKDFYLTILSFSLESRRILLASRRVNECYIVHATKIFQHRYGIKIIGHRWIETFANLPDLSDVNLCGAASLSTHFKISLRIQYHTMRCPRVCLYICRSCLRIYLKLVLRCGYVWTSMCSDACVHTHSYVIVEYIIRHKSGDEVCKTAANFARNRENSDARARKAVVCWRSCSHFFFGLVDFSLAFVTLHRPLDIRAHWPKLNSIENDYKIKDVRRDEFIKISYNFMIKIVGVSIIPQLSDLISWMYNMLLLFNFPTIFFPHYSDFLCDIIVSRMNQYYYFSIDIIFIYIIKI